VRTGPTRCPETSVKRITTRRRAISQKGADLKYTAVQCAEELLCLDPLNHGNRLNYIQVHKLSTYLTANTQRLHYKDTTSNVLFREVIPVYGQKSKKEFSSKFRPQTQPPPQHLIKISSQCRPPNTKLSPMPNFSPLLHTPITLPSSTSQCSTLFLAYLSQKDERELPNIQSSKCRLPILVVVAATVVVVVVPLTTHRFSVCLSLVQSSNIKARGTHRYTYN
jgi:hypothetical protein